MRFQRSFTSAFETRSVALFTALLLGSAAASAQSTAQPMTNAPAAATSAPAASASADAFKRADTNGDQRLSREEAKQLPAVAQNFDRLDADKDGSVSLAEFEKGVKAN